MEIIHADGHMCIIRGAHNERGHITGLQGRTAPLCRSVGSIKLPWAGTELLDNPGVPQCYNLTIFFKGRNSQTLSSNRDVAITHHETLGVLA